MAETVLSFVVEGTLARVVSLITDEITLACNFKDDLNELKDSLTMIRAVLLDAEEQQTAREPVRLWLKKLKDVAYDVEDVFDKLAYENLRQKFEMQDEPGKEVSSINPFPIVTRYVKKTAIHAKNTAFHVKMAHKVKKIMELLTKIKNEAMGFGLQVSSRDTIIPQIGLDRVTDSVLDNPVVGREADVSKIVNLLSCSCDQQVLTVVPIVGMGGLGKTALAKLVCQEVMARKLFDVKMWICVSDNCNDQRILGEMLQSLNGNMGGLTNNDAILDHLQNELVKKKFLRVLDDVWDDVSKWWDSLKNRLLKLCTNNGNAIVVTTRSEKVASVVETSPQSSHNLNVLSDDECWYIIKERVHGNRGIDIPSDLENIGKEIAKKCRGVPLAAKVLGGTLLGIKREKEAWLSIKNSKVVNASHSMDNVEAILKLSFDHLPSCLKPCFAYCSIFPKDYLIEREQLIQLWMAEGFLEPSNGDVGSEYFNALLCNSFFQDVERNLLENIEGCKMHDLVHDLAISLSKSEILNSENYSVGDDFSCIRRFNLNSQDVIKNSVEVDARKLRSVFLLKEVVLDKSWKLKNLRTLKLKGATIENLPSLIGECKRLRYLDISYTQIRVWPESISKLYNLQTLRFLDTSLLPGLSEDQMKNLVSLKHIEFSDDLQTPSGLGRLTSLERLSIFGVGSSGGRTIQELGCLNKLRGKLTIRHLENVGSKANAKRANLQDKEKITALKFVWDNREGSCNSSEEVLEGLQPHPNIQSIEIQQFWVKIFQHGC